MIARGPDRGAAAYRRVAVESDALGATPHRLIALLFEHACSAVGAARVALERGQVADKCRAIGRALALIEDGLRANLDREAGGELAARLDALYEYLVRRLAHANARNDGAALDEVHARLAELAAAWARIAPAAVPQPREAER
jgi:flagellar protein FliS